MAVPARTRAQSDLPLKPAVCADRPQRRTSHIGGPIGAQRHRVVVADRPVKVEGPVRYARKAQRIDAASAGTFIAARRQQEPTGRIDNRSGSRRETGGRKLPLHLSVRLQGGHTRSGSRIENGVRALGEGLPGAFGSAELPLRAAGCRDGVQMP